MVNIFSFRMSERLEYVIFKIGGSSMAAGNGKLNTWKRRLEAFSENTFLLIFLTFFYEIPRYATKMDARQI
jgi:hypothetical protein